MLQIYMFMCFNFIVEFSNNCYFENESKLKEMKALYKVMVAKRKYLNSEKMMFY